MADTRNLTNGMNGLHMEDGGCPRKDQVKYSSRLNKGFNLPGWKPKCTWSPKADPATSPHSKDECHSRQKIYSSIVDAVGNTPLVRLNKIPKEAGVQCEVLVKCEFFNPGGSVKDRIGFRMVEDAEKAGIIKPGYTLIEPTSGNTGLGIAVAAAAKGYRCIIVISEKMSDEKINVLKALGAEIVRVPITVDSFSPDGLFGVSCRLKQEIPNSIILDQYSNPGNPLAHYDNTAREIYEQCDGKVDMIVCGAGTAGTITGIGKKFKEISPSTVIVGADPEGSILAQPAPLNDTDVTFYEIEGLGYDFIPTCMKREVVDRWVKVKDADSFRIARKLIKDEGLLCGGSCGSAVWAALQAAKDLRPDQRVVVIMPDSIRNYLTKFVSDDWMEIKGFKECANTQNHWWWNEKVTALNLIEPTVVKQGVTCATAMELMKKQGVQQMPLVDKNSNCFAMVTMQKLMRVTMNAIAKPSDPVERASISIFPKVSATSTNLGLVSRILEKDPYVLVVQNETIDKESVEKPVGFATIQNLLEYIDSAPGTGNHSNSN